MVRQVTWRRGLAILLLVAAVIVVGATTRVKESSLETPGRLVFTNQFMPGVQHEAVTIAGASSSASPQSASSTQRAEVFAEEAVAPAMASVASQRNPEFDAYRASRLQTRARRMETVQRLLASEDLDDATRKVLHDEMLALSQNAELEERAEGLLLARGLYDAVVMINPSDADVIVSDRISREQAGQIGGVVARVAGVPLNRITIVDGAAPQVSPE